MQEVLLYARPRGTQFWQYTDSYSLVRVLPDGRIEPAPRFWLMKHFAELTPLKSEVLATTSDQDQVLVTAFRKNGSYTLHIVNRGGAREAELSGAPGGEWRVTESTEAAQFQQKARLRGQRRHIASAPARAFIDHADHDQWKDNQLGRRVPRVATITRNGRE